MQFSPLMSATLIKRYKRFLADVIDANNHTFTLHCANTGAMTGCADAGITVWYSTSNNAKRKYAHSWQLTETKNGEFICINTTVANQVAVEAIKLNKLPMFAGYAELKTEVKYGDENSRIDILLGGGEKPDCYIEVKSVTLLQQNQGYFPDAKTSRGQKHLRELMAMVDQGHRAVLLFVVMHSGINSLQPAAHIDPVYAKLLQQAIAHGVEVYACKTKISPSEICIDTLLPFSMSLQQVKNCT